MDDSRLKCVLPKTFASFKVAGLFEFPKIFAISSASLTSLKRFIALPRIISPHNFA